MSFFLRFGLELSSMLFLWLPLKFGGYLKENYMFKFGWKLETYTFELSTLLLIDDPIFSLRFLDRRMWIPSLSISFLGRLLFLGELTRLIWSSKGY